MQKFRVLVQLFIISSLLSACAANSGLWGAPSAPTPAEGPGNASHIAALPDTPSQLPGPSLTPSKTPLKVLRLPGSPTPGMAPTLPPLPTNTALPPTATLPPVNTAGPMDVYHSQGGDTLNIIATRFGVRPEQIIAASVLPTADAMIPNNTLLLLPKPDPQEQFSPGQRTIPDSEVVLGPSSLGFYIYEYVNQQGGYLSTYKSYMTSETITGVQAVERISQENSLSPRILLAIIEYESYWVLGQPTNMAQDEYPLGHVDFLYKHLFRQLMWASGALSDGYYRWRSGDLTTLTFRDGSSIRLNPNLNAGTAAIQYYFSLDHTRAEWEQAVAPNGFAALYARMFGPTWERAAAFEPNLPDGLSQPVLSLPFEPGKIWAFSGGPHSAWEEKGALAALDFAPGSDKSGCVPSDAWVLAPADGIVSRTDKGVVILDLDGDGYEETGWVILFMHIRSDGKVFTNQQIQKGEPIGHPSCEGGISTGTHMHIARKYNGEWILADGPLAFNMDGWMAYNGEAPYKGRLVRGDKVIEASTSGSFETRIIRDKE